MSLVAACLAIVAGGWAIRSLPLYGGIAVIAVVLSGLGAGLSAVRLDRPYLAGELIRPATLGIGINAFLVLAFGYALVKAHLRQSSGC